MASDATRFRVMYLNCTDGPYLISLHIEETKDVNMDTQISGVVPT